MNKWDVRIWLNCESRIREETSQIADVVRAYAEGHSIELAPHRLHCLEYRSKNKKWPYWRLYCYFLTANHIVDVVDAVPYQETERGKQWLRLVDSHFEVFGMPWRMRYFATVYAAMVSGGRKAVDNLKKKISLFIKLVEKDNTEDPSLFRRFRILLENAERSLDKYYYVAHLQDQREAIYALDYSVYLLHALLFEIGEALKFVPSREE